MGKENLYKQHGYENRKDYLDSLSDKYDVDKQIVYTIAHAYGEKEDFDGLVNALEDF